MKSLGIKRFCISSLADLVSIVHFIVVGIIVLGWWLMPHSVWHLLIILLTLASWIFTKSCILAKLEYKLRTSINPTVAKFDNGYLHYHLRFLHRHAPSTVFIRQWGYVYLISATFLWIAQYLLKTGMVV